MPELIGDLSSFPDYHRRLHDETVIGLSWLLENANVPENEKSTLIQIICDRIAMLSSELDAAPPFLDALIKSQVSHQLRVRQDFERGQLAVEQWVPFHRGWLVAGYFDCDTSADEIIRQLRANDPRHNSADRILAETRGAAEVQRKANDAKGDERVMAAVDSLSSRALGTFLEVETALRTGETILAHGDDANFIESAQAKTKAAAKAGDIEAQRVLTVGGQHDTAACLNPGHNPAIRK